MAVLGRRGFDRSRQGRRRPRVARWRVRLPGQRRGQRVLAWARGHRRLLAVAGRSRSADESGRDLCAATRQTSLSGLVGWLYSGHNQVQRVAPLAPLVTRAAAGAIQSRTTSCSAPRRRWPSWPTPPLDSCWALDRVASQQPDADASVATTPSPRLSVPSKLPPVRAAHRLHRPRPRRGSQNGRRRSRPSRRTCRCRSRQACRGYGVQPRTLARSSRPRLIRPGCAVRWRLGGGTVVDRAVRRRRPRPAADGSAERATPAARRWCTAPGHAPGDWPALDYASIVPSLSRSLTTPAST